MKAYWLYVGLTILFELPIFLLFWRKEGWLQVVLFCVLLNGFTNPLLNLVLTTWEANVYLLEAMVVAVEMLSAWIIFRSSVQKAFLFSIAANAFSYFMGVLLFYLGWL